MVFMIGSNHKVQYVHENTNINAPSIQLVKLFAQYLKKEARDLKIALIGKELSQEAISIRKARDSTARCVANELGIGHRFCDPERAEREALGIPSEREIREGLALGRCLTHQEPEEVEKEERKYWRAREECWYRNIRDQAQEAVIFICGADHVECFYSLLVGKGLKAQILIENWCEPNKERSVP